jgi:hypothetical protein
MLPQALAVIFKAVDTDFAMNLTGCGWWQHLIRTKIEALVKL